MPLNVVPTINPGDLGASAYMNRYLRDNVNALIALVGQQNLLVNPGFEVYQRGASVNSFNLAYLSDRWQLLLGTSSSIITSHSTTTIDVGSNTSFAVAYTHSASTRLDQKIENYRQLQGQVVTFSVRIRKGLANSVRPYISDSGSYTSGVSTTTIGSFETHTVMATISGGASSVTVGVEFLASDNLNLDNAVFAIGSLAPAYVPFDPQVDLARCQRYYEVLGAHMTGVATAAGQSIGGWVSFVVTKGGAPTVTKLGTWTTNNCGQPTAVSRTGAETRGVTVYTTSVAAGQVDCYITASSQAITAEWNPA